MLVGSWTVLHLLLGQSGGDRAPLGVHRADRQGRDEHPPLDQPAAGVHLQIPDYPGEIIEVEVPYLPESPSLERRR